MIFCVVLVDKFGVIHFALVWPVLLQVSSHAVFDCYYARVIRGLLSFLEVHHALAAHVVDSGLALMMACMHYSRA